MHHPAISNLEPLGITGKGEQLQQLQLGCGTSQVIYTAYMETRATEPEKLGHILA